MQIFVWLEGAWNRGQRNLTRDGSVIIFLSFFLLFFFTKDRTCASQGLERFNKGYHRIFHFSFLQLYVFHDHERISRKGGYYSTLRKKALTDEAQASWDHHWICEQMPVSVGQDDKEDREGGRKEVVVGKEEERKEEGRKGTGNLLFSSGHSLLPFFVEQFSFSRPTCYRRVPLVRKPSPVCRGGDLSPTEPTWSCLPTSLAYVPCPAEKIIPPFARQRCPGLNDTPLVRRQRAKISRRPGPAPLIRH